MRRMMSGQNRGVVFKILLSQKADGSDARVAGQIETTAPVEPGTSGYDPVLYRIDELKEDATNRCIVVIEEQPDGPRAVQRLVFEEGEWRSKPPGQLPNIVE